MQKLVNRGRKKYMGHMLSNNNYVATLGEGRMNGDGQKENRGNNQQGNGCSKNWNFQGNKSIWNALLALKAPKKLSFKS